MKIPRFRVALLEGREQNHNFPVTSKFQPHSYIFILNINCLGGSCVNSEDLAEKNSASCLGRFSPSTSPVANQDYRRWNSSVTTGRPGFPESIGNTYKLEQSIS